MKMGEFRRQMQTTDWPVVLRVDGKEVAVNSRDDVMVPSAGNLFCIFLDGAFEVVDCKHASVIRREKPGRS